MNAVGCSKIAHESIMHLKEQCLSVKQSVIVIKEYPQFDINKSSEKCFMNYKRLYYDNNTLMSDVDV